MSHMATNWAFEQPETFPDMKPSEWAVLMVLANCHNPVNGCFPSQDYIRSRTNLSERAVRDQLARLQGRGLIDWDCAREDGHRGSNRYRLAFEADFQPANSAGSDDADTAGATGKNPPEQPAESDTGNRQNLPPNPVREPVKEPVNEREARGRDQEARRAERPTGTQEHPDRDEEKPQDGKSDDGRSSGGLTCEQALMRWVKPTDPLRPAMRAWDALTPEQRQAAVDRMPDYLAHERQHKRTRFISFASYLADRPFERLQEGAGATAGRGASRAYLDQFDRPWWVLLFNRTMAARTGEDLRLISSMIHMAVTASSGVTVDPGEAPSATECEAYAQVWAGSEDYQAWMQWYRRHGVHLPQRDRIWAFFPSRQPPDDGGTGTGEDGSELARASGF